MKRAPSLSRARACSAGQDARPQSNRLSSCMEHTCPARPSIDVKSESDISTCAHIGSSLTAQDTLQTSKGAPHSHGHILQSVESNECVQESGGSSCFQTRANGQSEALASSRSIDVHFSAA